MSDGGGPAPDGATKGDETGPGVDNASAASINAPAEHPGDHVTGNPDEGIADDAPARALPENEVLAGLVESFADAEWSLSGREDVVTIPPEQLGDLARAAKDAGFEVCADVTAVDWFRQRRTRYDVVVNLLSQQHRLRLRLIAAVGGDEPAVPSMTPIWPGANFYEREAYDMFGIRFDGHPDLTRILMPDDWEGFPLRKDFSTGSVPVQFKGSHKVT